MKKYVKTIKNHAVKNFMGGISYELNPLDTLKMITASSIFGEPQYYRDGEFSGKTIKDKAFEVNSLFSDFSIINDKYIGLKTSEIMEKVIDEALDHNFYETIEWADTLRNEYYIRINPQIIMVRAAIHPKRKDFSNKYPSLFNSINNKVMARADEPGSQLTYYLYKQKSKSHIPSILKRSWAKKISSLSRYELYKYKNIGLGLIDTIRICHANNKDIDELMKYGTIKFEEGVTWENLRSNKEPWINIIDKIEIPHMALLRNLRGIFSEIDDENICNLLMEKLKKGVLKGKQFPFRYWSCMKAISEAEVYNKELILNTLEECMDISRSNLPFLKGKTICLSDNSGSAWGAFNSEYGTVTIAEIDNLSSVITAMNSKEGYVGKFGDKLSIYDISKKYGILSQTKEISKNGHKDVGGSTENGIWIFFEDAINKKIHYDNIFIYSDQQAGHGGLYGTAEEQKRYKKAGFSANDSYIDVAKLIGAYRMRVNPKVNVFSVQTAGYTNASIPEYGYRSNILYGWTGKELAFAKAMIDFWDNIDEK